MEETMERRVRVYITEALLIAAILLIIIGSCRRPGSNLALLPFAGLPGIVTYDGDDLADAF
jgi:hypothetical protein